MKIIKTTDKALQERALELALSVFLEFEASDYFAEGIDEFRKTLRNPDYIYNLCYYVAIEGNEIIGMLATRNKGSHIALLFVNSRWHRKGIGRKLIEYVRPHSEMNYMTVNSSPYAHDFYNKVGFYDTEMEQITNGIRYFPMKLIVNQK